MAHCWVVGRTTFTPQHRRLIGILRQLRVEAGLTQVELAERLGRPQGYVSKYETGERRLDLVELQQIAHAVGVGLGRIVRRFESSA